MSGIVIENQEHQLKEKINKEIKEFDNSDRSNIPTSPHEKKIEQSEQVKEIVPIFDEEFLFTPIIQGETLECEIKIEKGWFSHHKRYVIYDSKTKSHILTVFKSQCVGNTKYIFSKSNKQIEQVATLQSNFLGTEFILYSNGKSYKDTQEYNLLRQELAIIQYEFQLFKNKKGNLFNCFLPIIVNDKPEIIKPIDNFTGLRIKSRLQQNRNKEFLQFQSQQPIWNEQFQAFILPFNSRVNSPSTHNFLLKQIDPENHLDNNVNIQFGKQNQNKLNIDIKSPFTPIQAFSIIVSQLDNKLAI